MVHLLTSIARDIVGKRLLLYELSKQDLKQQYLGSLFGIVWIFLQPLLFISILYLVFSLGFRTQQIAEIPLSLYLVSGMVAWLMFVDNISATANSIRSYPFLVNKVDFRLSFMPFIKVISSLVPHLFLVVIAVGISWYQGYAPGVHTLQVFYYMFALSVLLIGIGWLTASTSLFVKDVLNIVAVIVQFGFWLTPIFWNAAMVPEKYQWLIKLNPLNYIVSGYRDSIIYRTPFWDKPAETLYYWLVTACIFVLGILVFRKLRPHFAEVI